MNIRGFSAFNDFFIDGIRDAAVYTRDIFDADSVEVLEGPSAVLFGRGSTGGAINQVTKAPLLTPLENLTSILGTNDLIRGTGDFDIPFASAAAFRSERHGRKIRGRGPRLRQKPSLGCCARAGLWHRRAGLAHLHLPASAGDNVPDGGIPFVDGAPAPVPRGNDYGLVSDVNTTQDDIATARYKHDFTSNISIADTLRYANYEFDYQSAMRTSEQQSPPPRRH